MPAVFPQGSTSITHVRLLAQQGDHMASCLMALLNNTYYIAMSAGAEGANTANTIRVTGQVTDQDGQAVKGVKNVLLTSVPVSGAGTMTIGTKGTLKAGSVSKSVWLQTDANGVFEIDVLNAAVEVNLVTAQIDNGTSEQLVLTYA